MLKMATKKRQSTQTVSSSKSTSLMKNLVCAAIGSVCYQRGVFPEENFHSKRLSKGAVTLHNLKMSDDNDEVNTVIEWIENGIWDSIGKGYVEEIVFNIHAINNSVLLESYVFTMEYDQRGKHQGFRFKTANQDVFKFKPTKIDSIQAATVAMMRSLSMLVSTFNPLPSERYLSLALKYNDRVPKSYQPDGFHDCDHHDILSFNAKQSNVERISVGNVVTGHHKLSLHMEHLNDDDVKVMVSTPITIDDDDDEEEDDERVLSPPPSVAEDEKNKCPHCNRMFSHEWNMLRHVKSKVCRPPSSSSSSSSSSVAEDEKNKCPHCNRMFSYEWNMLRHVKSKVCQKKRKRKVVQSSKKKKRKKRRCIKTTNGAKKVEDVVVVNSSQEFSTDDVPYTTFKRYVIQHKVTDISTLLAHFRMRKFQVISYLSRMQTSGVVVRTDSGFEMNVKKKKAKKSPHHDEKGVKEGKEDASSFIVDNENVDGPRFSVVSAPIHQQRIDL